MTTMLFSDVENVFSPPHSKEEEEKKGKEGKAAAAAAEKIAVRNREAQQHQHDPGACFCTG
jgi:hypothetical protein